MNFWLPKINVYSKRLSMWQEKLWLEANGKPYMGILDNIAGRKTFEYATFGPRPESIVMPPQQMTAACVWNASNAIPTGPALDTTMDQGRGEYDQTPSTDDLPLFAYGYDGGSDRLGLLGFGTLTNATYTDGGATSRTISSCYYTEPGGSPDDDVSFMLNTTSVADTDTTFVSIEWQDNGGTVRTYTRASRNIYTASLNGGTLWAWTNVAYDHDNQSTGKIFRVNT